MARGVEKEHVAVFQADVKRDYEGQTGRRLRILP